MSEDPGVGESPYQRYITNDAQSCNREVMKCTLGGLRVNRCNLTVSRSYQLNEHPFQVLSRDIDHAVLRKEIYI